MSQLEVLQAVLADMVGQDVEFVSSEKQNDLTLSIDDAFSSSYKYDDEFSVNIKLPSESSFPLTVSPESTVRAIKKMIYKQKGVPVSKMRLRLNSTDLDDGLTVRDAGIQKDSTLCVLYRLRGGVQKAMAEFAIPYSELVPKYDFDLTKVQDDGKIYIRGGFEYKRPYGWYRYAVKVVGKYEDDKWLGPNGIRTNTVSGEWPVAYHGTKQTRDHACIGKIVAEGLKPGPRQLYGRGIYTSPSLTMVANNYAKTVFCKGKYCRYVLQTRVDPTSLNIIKGALEGADYWLSPSNAVRPYGILVQEV